MTRKESPGAWAERVKAGAFRDVRVRGGGERREHRGSGRRPAASTPGWRPDPATDENVAPGENSGGHAQGID
ncbi:MULTISPECIES: hypothetical protein [unclassified Streptomyces]|uniref:hypothetical protein n=1 Tax=unclassified Streptomyces TaxID=2593676 RepID=UPI000F470968|nr:hypothetical protein [Streptomyces sp. PanSC9]ROP47305.1 hypothetical protein EDD94_6988 [Streptomyces sp. PanSC9]